MCRLSRQTDGLPTREAGIVGAYVKAMLRIMAGSATHLLILITARITAQMPIVEKLFAQSHPFNGQRVISGNIQLSRKMRWDLEIVRRSFELWLLAGSQENGN